jgi:hypothetical protein
MWTRVSKKQVMHGMMEELSKFQCIKVYSKFVWKYELHQGVGGHVALFIFEVEKIGGFLYLHT